MNPPESILGVWEGRATNCASDVDATSEVRSRSIGSDTRRNAHSGAAANFFGDFKKSTIQKQVQTSLHARLRLFFIYSISSARKRDSKTKSSRPTPSIGVRRDKEINY